ncbi:MAG: MlaD family protein [Myxococcota bacterium]
MTDGQSPAQKERKSLLRAGLLVAVGLALSGVFVFLIGSERHLFRRSQTYRTAFANVEGLSADSPVWLSGLEVGRVRAIGIAPSPQGKQLVVELEVLARYEEWVRRDSVARILGRGLLGDKAIDVSIGSKEAPPVGPGGFIESGPSEDLSALLKQSGEILSNSVAITQRVREAVESYASPQLQADVLAAVSSLRSVMEQVEKGEGALHTLIYDVRFEGTLHALIDSAAQSAARLDRALAETEELLARVRTGEGTAHALLYEREALTSLERVGEAAKEIATFLERARQSPDSALHQMAFGDTAQFMADLSQAADNLRAVTAKVREGEGSLGAIINDPTVYEDLKLVLGDLRRNRVLRGMVRYLMRNGDELRKAGRPTGAAEQGTGGSGR